jgi:hypothetical protein
MRRRVGERFDVHFCSGSSSRHESNQSKLYWLQTATARCFGQSICYDETHGSVTGGDFTGPRTAAPCADGIRDGESASDDRPRLARRPRHGRILIASARDLSEQIHTRWMLTQQKVASRVPQRTARKYRIKLTSGQLPVRRRWLAQHFVHLSIQRNSRIMTAVTPPSGMG